MQQLPQITIRDITHSEAVEEHLLEKIDKLNQFFDRIISCHVVVEQTQKHQTTGKLYHIRIRLSVPGKELMVNHNNNEDTNLYISIRDAFKNMERQIKHYAQEMHGEMKWHSETTEGEIVRLFDQDRFGFIRGFEDDTEFYFNADNVVSPQFEHLKVGTEVHFIEAMGDEGHQAHRVSAPKRITHNED